MTLNPLTWYRQRRAKEKHAAAMEGRMTSGHLTPGERQRIFRDRHSAASRGRIRPRRR